MITITGSFKIDNEGIYVFDDYREAKTDSTSYNIENSFIKDLKIMAFLEFIRLSHVLKIVKPKDLVLDVGCGYGHYGYSLYTNRYETQYVGVDINRKYLSRAISRKWGNSKPTFILKDAIKGLPFNDDTFDVILLIQVVEHLGVANSEKLLFECVRILNPNGILILSTENNKFTTGGGLDFHPYEFTYDELTDLVLRCGLKIKEEFGLMYAHNIKELPESSLKKFLHPRHFKIFEGINHPKDSKYIIFDLEKDEPEIALF